MARAATVPQREAAVSLEQRLRGRLDRLTKPRGSLGRLEELAVQVGVLLGSERPRLVEPQVLVFAADHGIADDAVSAYPKAVTGQMLRNYLGGGAAINVLVRQHGLALTLIDAGVQGFVPPPAAPHLVSRRIGDGTRNCRLGPAMTATQRDAALAAGREVAAACLDAGSNVLLLGEMGIGNTASAALMLQRLTGWPLEACVGRGTGVDDQGLRRKLAVLAEAAARVEGALSPRDVLSEFGGFEIAMLVGALLEASSRACVVVVDGFTVSVAALLADRLAPGVAARCVFSHLSAERAHARLLEHLGVGALLDLGLRLGEGSGAALAWPLLQSSLVLLEQMASFEAAGVSDRGD
jgi:nicotinate-nucleotide--dimethylbenzimidazole phosphoribosyltransferase